MKRFTNLKCIERTFWVGDWVYLRLQPYKQQSVQLQREMKLSSRFYGPYQVIEQINIIAYCLQLPIGRQNPRSLPWILA